MAIAAVAGINVATIDQMPGKLASAIAQSRQPVDTDALWATSDGKATLFTLFVDSVSPAPRQDITCDNARVDDIWQSWYDGTPIRVFAWERDNFNFRPCLNPTPIAGASATDPHFVVTEQFGSTSETPTITFAHPDAATTTTIRVRGDNWFVAQRPGGGETPDVAPQHHRLGGTHQHGLARAHRRRLPCSTASGPTRDGTLEADPDDCTTCWTSDELQYVGPDGHAPLGADRVPPAAHRPAVVLGGRTSSRGRRSPSTPTTSRPAVRSAR